MRKWFCPTHTEPASTVALAEAFMQMDDALTQVQVLVDEYRSLIANKTYDAVGGVWNSVLTVYDQANTNYLRLTAADAQPTQDMVNNGTDLLRAATSQIEDFRKVVTANLDAERRIVQAEAAAAARAEAERAQKTAQAAEDARKAVSSVSTRLQAVRTRLDDIPNVKSALLKEFTWADCKDVIDGVYGIDGPLGFAADMLARARADLHNNDPAAALESITKARRSLTEAEQRIDAIPHRLQELRGLRDNPQQRADKVRFALRDAQMFCVNHHLEKQWASVLDAQVQRIETLEASLKTAAPNYWAYATGLDKISEFIGQQVDMMRDGIRRTR